jgi:tetratricopeptide (TPR) repeat protein
MTATEWFRRSTWTDQDRAEFDARLKRARGAASKAQYLRIQAVHLAQAELHAAAIELLDRMFAEFPERIELAQAHLQKAESLAALGKPDAAIAEFRAALQAQRQLPNVRTQAWLDFGWFVVVERQQTDLFDEVATVLDEFRTVPSLSFPVEEYRYCTIRSLLAESRGDQPLAREFATRALAQATRDHSEFRYHPKLGLVGTQPAEIERRLKRLAAG